MTCADRLRRPLQPGARNGLSWDFSAAPQRRVEWRVWPRAAIGACIIGINGVSLDDHIGDLSEYGHLLAVKSNGKLRKFYAYLIGDTIACSGWQVGLPPIHVIVDRVVPRDDVLRSIGRMDLPITHGRGDGATHPGSPDCGDEGWRPGARYLYLPPFATAASPDDLIRVRSHDFH